jgi:hypothetical protein
LGFCVETVQVRCPDCTARRRGKLYRIEFEYRASDYERHGHSPHAADIVVCWENDWESRRRRYKHLEIIDLKPLAGAFPRIFVSGCNYAENLKYLNSGHTEWNVPLSAQLGDLVLMYRTDTHAIHDAWEVVGPFNLYAKGNKQGRWPGLQAGLRRVVKFDRPLGYAALKNNPTTRDLGVVISRFRGKQDVTDGWPLISDIIVSLNPRTKKVLAKYRFDED